MTSTDSKKRILVIDDDPDIRLLLMAVLRRRGYEVIPAPDGADGSRALELFDPDLVILDLMMPKLDGHAFLRSIENRKGARSVPIVVISAHLQNAPGEVLKMGATTLLPKPFDTAELVGLIDSLI